MSAQHTPSDTFRFDPDAKRRRVSNERILAELRRFAKRRGSKRILQSEFRAWRGRSFCPSLASERFGSWHAALLAAGLPGAVRRRFQAGELMEILERAWRRVGYPPTMREIRAEGLTDVPYAMRWGSLVRARRRLAEFKEGRITREELLTVFPPAPPKRGRLAASVRLAVLKRDGHRCALCGQGPAQGAVLEVDHIRPVSLGGGNEMENLRTLCLACNRGKGKKAA